MSVLLGVFSSDQEMYPYTNPNPQHWCPYPNGPPPQYPPVNYTVVPSQQPPPPPPQYPYQQPQYFPAQQPFAPPPQYTPQVQQYPVAPVPYAAHPPQWYPTQWHYPQPQAYAPPQQYYQPQQQYGPPPQPAYLPQPQTHHLPSQSAPDYVPSQPLPPQYDATTVAPAQYAPVFPQRQMTRSPSESSSRGSSRQYCFDEDYQTSSDVSRSSSPERGFDNSSPTETDIASPTDIPSPDLSTVSFGSLLNTEGTSLAVLNWEAWMAALARANKVANELTVPEGEVPTMPPPCDKFFDPMPWRTCHRKLRRHHIYPDNEDGSQNYGMLWAELYLCSKSSQFGLCWYTFGTPGRCPLGATCRWEQYLPWRKLRFLITSGRVSVELARQLMANLKSDEDPDQHPRAKDNMEAIIIGLGERLQPKVLLSRRGSNAWSWEDIYSAPAVVG